MSHDFDDELERSTERRSRRNPRMRDTAAYGSSGQEGGYASEQERWESRQKTPGSSRAGAGRDGRFPYPCDPEAAEKGKQSGACEPELCAGYAG